MGQQKTCEVDAIGQGLAYNKEIHSKPGNWTLRVDLDEQNADT